MFFVFEAVTTGTHIEIFCFVWLCNLKRYKAFLPLRGQARIKLNRPQTIYQRFQYTFEVELNHIS